MCPTGPGKLLRELAVDEMCGAAVVAVCLVLRSLCSSSEAFEGLWENIELATPEILALNAGGVSLADDSVFGDCDVGIPAVAGHRDDSVWHREVRVGPAGKMAVPPYIVRLQSLIAQSAHHSATAGVGHTTAVLRAVDEQCGAIYLLRDLEGVRLIPGPLLPFWKLDDDPTPYQLSANTRLAEGFRPTPAALR